MLETGGGAFVKDEISKGWLYNLQISSVRFYSSSSSFMSSLFLMYFYKKQQIYF